MLGRTLVPLFSALLLLGSVQSVSAALYDASIGSNDVSFSPEELILGDATRIYATISNAGERDVEGTVRFYDNDTLIGAKPFSIRANLRPEDAWVRWSPQAYGSHTIRVVVDNDPVYTDGTPANNTVTVTAFVDRDTDRDGVPDQQDEDRDNDTILNRDEVTRGTDPFNRDTDGDGVDDAKDVFPLDSKRSVTPPPVPTSTARVVAPAATRPRATVVPTPTIVQAPTVRNVVPAPSLLTTPATSSSSIPEPTSPEALVEVTSTPELPVIEPIAPLVVSSTPTSSAPSNSLNALLAAAAVLSAGAAGMFVWLGRRS
jgi:hypothetical protein